MQAVQSITHGGGVQLLRITDVETVTGMSRAYIYKQVALGKFPRPHRIGKRASRWVRSDVETWVRAQLYTSNESR